VSVSSDSGDQDDHGRDASRQGFLGLDYERIYEFRFGGVDQDARQAVWNETGRFLWDRMGRPRRVLDPAGGRGEFVNAIPAEERWLVDFVDYPHRFVDSGVKLVIGDIFSVELPDAYFDGIFVSNLLEHLESPEAVATFLSRMHGALAPRGTLAVMGPNFKHCARQYFDCADHVLALTDVSVCEHLVGAGFDIREAVARFLPFSFRSRLPATPALTRAYLRTPIAWRFLGQQFLVMATKGT
jgi:hypothetical protein